jgi:hypothetical protein
LATHRLPSTKRTATTSSGPLPKALHFNLPVIIILS